jgi:hypothetical protein
MKNFKKTNFEIFETTDYDMFQYINGNRDVKESHVKHLMKSFEERFLISPISINDRFEILDGQHRVEACRRLGLPVYFSKISVNGSVDKNMDIVITLNKGRKDWPKEEYLNSFVKRGFPAYIEMKKFMDQYPDFSIGSVESILANYGGNPGPQVFKSGEFQIPDLTKAILNANQLLDFKPYFKDFKTSAFVRVMISLFNNPTYNHSAIMNKLSYQPNALTKQAGTKQYLKLLEDILNWKNKGERIFLYK